MISRVELKEQAKKQLKGKVWILFLCMLIVSAISGVVGIIPYVGIIGTFLLMPPLYLGLMKVYLNVTYGDEPKVETVFEGFQNFSKSVLLYLQITIFTFLWSLLFVVPGIIKALSYSMSTYILAEHPDMTASEALAESKKIMDGHKMDLFVLQLSFILWALLCGITCGIASIYVTPYMSLTMTNFYHKIKETQPDISAEDLIQSLQ